MGRHGAKPLHLGGALLVKGMKAHRGELGLWGLESETKAPARAACPGTLRRHTAYAASP